MSVIVRDYGFDGDDWEKGFTAYEPGEPLVQGSAIDLKNDADVEALVESFDSIPAIRIDFPSSADGRGFSLARHLRLLGYKGRLRAYGHVLADQYAMARRSGFDEVQIDEDLANRQPEDQWLARADWQSHDYQNRLGRAA